MAKIPGNIVGLPSPRSDWNQTNEAKADFIKNKPTKLSQFENDKSYVKNTDYATWNKGGVVIAPTSYGTEVNNKGQLRIVAATDNEIKDRSHKYKPIVPSNLEYAVKSVGDGYYATEKQVGDISAALDELHTYAQALIGGDA